MANGNSSFNLRECESFFAPLADAIVRFAALRNLALAKYDHESPSWDLSFAHPTGGFGRISLTRTSEAALHLSALVWKDDYERFTRHVRLLAPQPIEGDGAHLLSVLAQILDEVLGWPIDKRFTSYTGYEREWGRMSKEQFMSSQPSFPVPVPRRHG